MWSDRRILFGVAGGSLLLNVFLVGIVFGHVVGTKRKGSASAFVAAGPLVPPAHVKALAPEERKRFREAMAPHRNAIRSAREAHREAKRIVEADLAASSFDAAKVTADFAALRRSNQMVSEVVDAALVDAVSKLSPESRASLVAHVRPQGASEAAPK